MLRGLWIEGHSFGEHRSFTLSRKGWGSSPVFRTLIHVCFGRANVMWFSPRGMAHTSLDLMRDVGLDMCVCIYVGMCVCIYVGMCVRINVGRFVDINVFMCVCIDVGTCVRIDVGIVQSRWVTVTLMLYALDSGMLAG